MNIVLGIFFLIVTIPNFGGMVETLSKVFNDD